MKVTDTSSKAKKWEVDRVYNSKHGVAVPIVFDKRTKRFYGVVGPDKIEDETADGCSEKVRDAIEAFYALEWRRIIVVQLGGGFHQTDEDERTLKLDFSRHMVAQCQGDDDDWVENVWAKWEDSDENWLSLKGDNVKPYRGPTETAEKYGEMVWVIDYDVEAWRVLEQIDGRIADLRAQLRKFLEKADLLGRLKALKYEKSLPMLEGKK